MRTFLVAVKDAGGDPDALMRKLDKDVFPESYEYIKGQVWLVAARLRTATCSDVLEALAPEEMSDSGPGRFRSPREFDPKGEITPQCRLRQRILGVPARPMVP